MGLGTDGTALMIGKENGLTAKVKHEVPHVVHQHCVTHKLHLSVSNSVENVKYKNQVVFSGNYKNSINVCPKE